MALEALVLFFMGSSRTFMSKQETFSIYKKELSICVEGYTYRTRE